MAEEVPAFEVHTSGQVLLIYASGRIERIRGPQTDTDVEWIVNRIPALIDKAVRDATTGRSMMPRSPYPEQLECAATAIRLALHEDYSHLSERDMSREIAKRALDAI